MIPRKIYQSWKTKNLPPELQKVVNKTKALNPNYEYHLYDDEDCRKFLLDNFGINYVNAFDALVPGAFKCDFWRYAVLYVNGGIYMDLDMEALVPFDEMIDSSDGVATDHFFVSVIDATHFGLVGIYQAFLACTPKHPIMMYALKLTFSNIVMRRKSIMDILSVTGPGVMAAAVNLYLKKADTNTPFTTGVQKGIKLFTVDFPVRNVFDLNGKPIINAKIQDYQPLSSYMTQAHYRDAQRIFNKKNTSFLVIFILLIFLLFYYRRKTSGCNAIIFKEK